MTNSGVLTLAKLPALRELQLFGSGVSAGSLSQLSASNAGRRLKVALSKQCWWMS